MPSQHDLDILKLPFSPTQEMIDSGVSLYNYRKSDKFIELMPSQEEVEHLLNDGYVTLRELMYREVPNGHFYFYLESLNNLSPYALKWTRGICKLKPAGEKKFKGILDSRVTLDDRGLLVIHYKFQKTADDLMYALGGAASSRTYFTWGDQDLD